MHLKFIIGIDDGLDAIVFLDDAQPLQHALLELLGRLLLGLVLHVEHGRQVAFLELHLADEEVGLVASGGMDAIEMIGAACKSMLAGLMEVVAEVLVDTTGTLGSLDHDKPDGALVDESLVAQLVPVDVALVMADVNAVNLVARRIADVAVQGTPTETEGADEDVVEEINVKRQNGTTAYPHRPTGHELQQADEDVRFFMNPEL